MPWQFRLQLNPDHNKFASLYNLVEVTVFPYLYSGGGGIPSKKSSRATLKRVIWEKGEVAGERKISSTAKNRTIMGYSFSKFSKVPTALIYSNLILKNHKNISADPAGKERSRESIFFLQNYWKLDLEWLLTTAAFRVRLLFRLSRNSPKTRETGCLPFTWAISRFRVLAWQAKFRTGNFRPGFVFNICTNRLHLQRNGFKNMKLVLKNNRLYHSDLENRILTFKKFKCSKEISL